jgi:hypothetical protein
MIDRFASLVLPYLRSFHGEIHHAPRYTRYPRWVGIGVQEHADEHEALLFKLLVGRNAINFHAPSFAADVIPSTGDSDRLRANLQQLLTRKDPTPWGDAIKSLMPVSDAPVNQVNPLGTRHATLVIGSAKTQSPSTSGGCRACFEQCPVHSIEMIPEPR